MSRASSAPASRTRSSSPPNTHDFLVRLVAAASAPSRAASACSPATANSTARGASSRAGRRPAGCSGRARRRPSRSTTFSDRFLDRAQSRRARLHLCQPGAVRQRPHVRSGRRAGRARRGPTGRGSSSTAITRSWRIERPFGDSRRRDRPSTSAAATNMRWRARAAPSCTRRPASATRPRDHRLVRRVRGSEPAAGQRRLRQGRDAASSARPSTRRRSTGSTRCSGCCAENGLTTARISGARRGSCSSSCSARSAATALGGGRAAQPARRRRRTPASSPSAVRTRSAGTQQLKAQNCITDVRGDVLRIGFGIYQDEDDVERLVELLRGLA